MKNSTPAKLILEDGSEFAGKSFGYSKSISGEIVFNTGMVGYPENLTDPSYKGQILTLTYPLIGNYGIPEASYENNLLQNFESERVQIEGLIVSDYSHEYSHWNAAKGLGEWLIEHKVPGLYDIDTRELTKILRTKGSMLAKIVFDDQDLPFYNPDNDNLVSQVSTREKVFYKAPQEKYKVLLVDCGVKYNIIRCLLKRGASVLRVPWDYDYIEAQEEYDALFISNGPGNPKMYQRPVEVLKKALMEESPIFGICLGNQLLSLAIGADTYKLKYGHRSQNQPCTMVGTNKCSITSQNHGFAVDDSKLPEDWIPWFKNANDDTNEGIKHVSKPFFSVQFHPESSAGPVDTEFLFNYFVELMESKK